jgi:protein SCO1/2
VIRLAGFLAAVLAVGAGCAPRPEAEADAPALQEYPIGGDFVLTGPGGEPWSLEQARGKVVLLFFGYTLCPDFCPMTLSKLVQVDQALGDADDGKLLTVFVSLDPERDSPEGIAEYLSYYALEAVGLTGSREEIDAVVASYGGSYSLDEVDSAMRYLVTHSTYVYLIDGDGRVRHLYGSLDDAAAIAAGVRQLLAAGE